MSRREILLKYILATPSVQAEWCKIENLGSEDPSNVVFTKSEGFPTESGAWEEVVIDGNYFAKFTTWYKGDFVVDENNNLRGFTIATVKLNDSFVPYDCFLDEDGNELPYILLGEYRMSSSSIANSVNARGTNINIASGRALAKAKGTGYQLMDAAMQIFWRDLALACGEKVDFNPGTGIASYLGLKRMNEGDWFIDGIGKNNGSLYYSNKPSKYTNEPTSSSDGYSTLSYTCPTTGNGNCVKELGYDANHPTISFPREQSGNNDFTKYYCDGYYYSSGNRIVDVYVGMTYAHNGLFSFAGDTFWSLAGGLRLAYRPIGGN